MGEVMIVRRLERLDADGRQVWGRLSAGYGFYQSELWHQWQQHDNPGRTWYLLTEDDRGDPLGGAVVFEWLGDAVPSMNLAYSPGHMVEDVTGRPLTPEQHRAWLPCLLVGSRAGYDGGFVMRQDLGAEVCRQVMACIAAEVECLRRDVGAAAWAVEYCPTDQAAMFLTASRDLGLPVVSGDQSAAAVLDPWAPVRSKHSREWDRERRIFEATGGNVNVSRLSEMVDDIAPLLGRTQAIHQTGDTTEVLHRYLLGQAEVLNDCSVVLSSRGRVGVEAFVLGFVGDGVLALRTAGMAADAPRFSYFALVMTASRELARDLGLTQVHLGAGSYATKAARGAVPRWNCSIIRPPDGVPAEWREALSTPRLDHRDASKVWTYPGSDRRAR